MTHPPETIDLRLTPEDNERLANLSGQTDAHLRQIERRLGIEIANRGYLFRLIGEREAVRAGEQVLLRLYEATEDQVLSPESVHLYLQESGVDALLQDVEERLPELVLKLKRAVIRARGPNQQEYLHAIGRNDINFGVGPAGTGKTYLAVACAVEALETDRVRRLMLVRPAVEAGERLGFLPGDLAQKIDPYLRPLYDALYEMFGFEKVNKLIERNVIEVAPLAYMRGRAQPYTSQVLTPQGFRPIGRIKVGDFVIGSDGSPTPVLGLYPQGRKKVFRIRTQDGAETRCCEEHLWAVATPDDRQRGRSYRVLETRQMIGNLRRGHVHRFELPRVTSPVVFEFRDIPLDPYALGLLLGGGCLTTSSTPSFATGDAELALALEAALDGIELHRKSEIDYILRHAAGRRGGVIVSNPVTVALRELGLAGTRSTTKFVPENYLYNTPDIRLSLLQGLLDTDGGAVTQRGRTCRIQYSTCSERLRDDFLFLVRSLGGVAYWRMRKAAERSPGRARGRPVYHRADTFVFDIRLPEGIEPFRLTRKREAYRVFGGGRPMRFIHNIEPAGEEDMLCIQVAAADSLYVTDDFLVTHNTLNDAFIILDEAQNTTPEQMKMFLTRIGFGSTAVVTGDVTQVDLPRGQLSGLRQAIEILGRVDGISFTFFNARDVVRHALVQRIVSAYDSFDLGTGTSAD